MSVFLRPNGRFAAQMYDRSLGRGRQIGTFDTREDAERAIALRSARAAKSRRARRNQRKRMDHWVYIAYDAAGALLYVGITWQALARLSEHRAESRWTESVARIDVEHFPTRAAALAREDELIRTLHPPHNRRGARPPVYEGEMSIEEVGSLVGMSVGWVKREIISGRLASVERTAGGRPAYVVTRDAYDAWLEEH